MSKKSFTNPAMAFLTSHQEEKAQDFNLTQPTKEDLEAQERAKDPKPTKAPRKPATKKEVTQDAPPMKRNPEYIETKSVRVQLVMQPTLKNSITELAKNKGISFNELVHTVLKDYLDQN